MLRLEGYTLVQRKIQQIRRNMGLIARVNGSDTIEQSNAVLTVAIEEELKTGIPAQYGKEYFYQHLRAKGIPVARYVKLVHVSLYQIICSETNYNDLVI